MMTPKRLARGSITRAANVNKRKHIILERAGDIIANHGVDALTMSKLALAADVTVPTIHNLFGKKADIFEKLVVEMVERVEKALADLVLSDPIIASEAFIDKLIALFRANEGLYKAAFVAGENTKIFDQKLPGGIFQTSLDICSKVCQKGLDDGYLLGSIRTEVLARQVFGCQRLARQDWVNGYIDLDKYRAQVLCGMFITFMADARQDYKEMLQQRVEKLSSHHYTKV